MVRLKRGKAYRFKYPRHNYNGIQSYLETRRIVVESIRDTSEDHLDPSTEVLNPNLKRGRWLVTGRDIDKGAERSFYLESMTELKRLNRYEVWAVVDLPDIRCKCKYREVAAAFAQGRGADSIVVKIDDAT